MFETGFPICVLTAFVIVLIFVGGNLFCKEKFDLYLVNGEDEE